MWLRFLFLHRTSYIIALNWKKSRYPTVNPQEVQGELIPFQILHPRNASQSQLLKRLLGKRQPLSCIFKITVFVSELQYVVIDKSLLFAKRFLKQWICRRWMLVLKTQYDIGLKQMFNNSDFNVMSGWECTAQNVLRMNQNHWVLSAKYSLLKDWNPTCL